jgi:hypothetical protein
MPRYIKLSGQMRAAQRPDTEACAPAHGQNTAVHTGKGTKDGGYIAAPDHCYVIQKAQGPGLD